MVRSLPSGAAIFKISSGRVETSRSPSSGAFQNVLNGAEEGNAASRGCDPDLQLPAVAVQRAGRLRTSVVALLFTRWRFTRFSLTFREGASCALAPFLI
jgi:hypothetical protein